MGSTQSTAHPRLFVSSSLLHHSDKKLGRGGVEGGEFGEISDFKEFSEFGDF